MRFLGGVELGRDLSSGRPARAATTRSSTPPAQRATAGWASRARTCRARAPRRTSSTGTAAIPTRRSPSRSTSSPSPSSASGNVAVDVARVLAVPGRPPASHRRARTTCSRPCERSSVREVHLIGRRGPEHGKFTTKELRELGELDGVTAVADAEDLPADEPDRERHVAANLTVIASWVGRDAQAGRPRDPTPTSGDAPSRSSGTTASRRIRLESSRPDGTGDVLELPGPGGRPGGRLPEPPAAGDPVRRGQRRRPQRRDRPRASATTAGRCPVSTWPAGSSAVPPA